MGKVNDENVRTGQQETNDSASSCKRLRGSYCPTGWSGGR
jgi:hypothetical protein